MLYPQMGQSLAWRAQQQMLKQPGRAWLQACASLSWFFGVWGALAQNPLETHDTTYEKRW